MIAATVPHYPLDVLRTRSRTPRERSAHGEPRSCGTDEGPRTILLNPVDVDYTAVSVLTYVVFRVRTSKLFSLRMSIAALPCAEQNGLISTSTRRLYVVEDVARGPRDVRRRSGRETGAPGDVHSRTEAARQERASGWRNRIG